MKKITSYLTSKFFKTCPKTGRIRGINNVFKSNKILFPIFGIVALVWFLIRVIPKPSRIAYPCQQAAAGIGLSFLAYVFAFISSYPIFKLIYKYIHRNVAYFFILILVSGSVITLNYAKAPDFSKIVSTFVPAEGPNAPIGVAKGLFAEQASSQYNPQYLARNNYLDWKGLTTKVLEDIDIAKGSM